MFVCQQFVGHSCVGGEETSDKKQVTRNKFIRNKIIKNNIRVNTMLGYRKICQEQPDTSKNMHVSLTLNVIQTIDTNQNFVFAQPFAQFSHSSLTTLPLKNILKKTWLNTNGKDTQGTEMSRLGRYAFG